MKKDSTFWVGYSDMLTSLFFVMLVLFGISFLIVKQQNEQLVATADQVKQIKQVEKALGSLDPKYYSYDEANNRYKLNIDVLFRPGSNNINDIPKESQQLIKSAGFELYNKINQLVGQNPEIEYLLVIEGNAARYNNNWITIPDQGYNLSYRRALALVNYWKNTCNIPFDEISDNCELLIAGSGYFGQSRETNEQMNKRFTIQITSKVGKFLNQDARR